MNKVIILQELRLGSQRLPRKILEEVGGERLIDIGLKKLRMIEDLTAFAVAVVAYRGEHEIVEAIGNHELNWIQKSEASARAETWAGQFDGWEHQLRDFDWVLFVNAVCHPFLTVETILRMAECVQTATHPWVTAIEERGQVWQGSAPLLPHDTLLSSKTSPAFRRPTHLGTACAIADLYQTDRILIPHPAIFELSHTERIDIDTQVDLDHARLVADGLAARERREKAAAVSS